MPMEQFLPVIFLQEPRVLHKSSFFSWCGFYGENTSGLCVFLIYLIDQVDLLYQEAARHYDEKGLAAIVLMIATTNLFNHLNATAKQVACQNW